MFRLVFRSKIKIETIKGTGQIWIRTCLLYLAMWFHCSLETVFRFSLPINLYPPSKLKEGSNCCHFSNSWRIAFVLNWLESPGCLVSLSSLEYSEIFNGSELFRWVVGSSRVKIIPTSFSINFYPTNWYKSDSISIGFAKDSISIGFALKFCRGLSFNIVHWLIINVDIGHPIKRGDNIHFTDFFSDSEIK